MTVEPVEAVLTQTPVFQGAIRLKHAPDSELADPPNTRTVAPDGQQIQTLHPQNPRGSVL